MTNTLYKTLQHFTERINDIECATTPEHLPQELCETDSLPLVPLSSSIHRREPTLRPRLPVEILDTVFSYLSPTALKPLLVTNSFVSSLSTRRFYHTVKLTRPASIIAFLRTVLGNPELPILVRSLDINICNSVPISNFYSLLQRVLRHTTGLLALSLDLPKSHSPLWVFDKCTFKLKLFSSTINCRRPLAAFLETQNHLTDLTLRGYQSDSVFFLPFIDPLPPSMLVPASDMFSLSPQALPELKAFNAVHADACIVQTVVQGRPVEVVSIPLFPEMGIAALDALQMSNAPLKRLSVISFDPSAPAFLLEALATRFDQLEALHLVMLMADYSNELLEQSGALLSNFKCLKYITFMAATAPTTPPAPTTPAAAISAINSDSGEEEARIAKVWHRACPTLRTIILPKGKVWFQSAPDAEQAPGMAIDTDTQDNTTGANVVNDTQETLGDVQEQEEQWSHL